MVSWNPAYFSQAWAEFGAQHFDVCVIGGGSVGAGAALDAASRGLKVAVVEARDFASGTSSRSSKMFHGGLRYLAMLDFRLVAESLRERELSMSTLAPHLVKPLRFIFPLTHRVWERPYMASGFALYDLMGGAKSVPMQKHLSRAGTLRLAPGLKDDVVVGGVRYFDTLVDDARHTLTVLRTAAELGAVVRPSTQVVGLTKVGSRVVGARLLDTDTGSETTLSHIVVPRDCLDADAALCFVTEKSVLFVIPWGEYWIIGTTDTDWDKNLAYPAATRADIDYILAHVNEKVRHPITVADIVGVYSGLRPLVSGTSESTTNLSRNHAVARVTPGLVSVAGGKYTTYRVIGRDAVAAAVQDIRGRMVPESVTDATPLLGAERYQAVANHTPALAHQYGLTTAQVEHLLGRYGSLVREVLALGVSDPALLAPIPGAPRYLLVEAVYAVTHEGALHVADIIERRLRIAMEYGHRGVECAAPIAQVVAPYLGWSATEVTAEVDGYAATVAALLSAEQEATDAGANEMVARVSDPRSRIDVSQDR